MLTGPTRETAESPRMFEGTFPTRRAWRRGGLTPADWLEPVPPACLDELDEVVRRLRRDPRPILTLAPGDFDLGACGALMGRVRDRLRAGVGLAVLDRLPVERYSVEENRGLCWLLGRLLGRPVAQKWDGAMLYDVRDTGKSLEYGVRRSVTNLDLTFHTDAAWLDLPPELVGLYCINRAIEGGVSRFVSLCTAHDELRRRRPDLLARLYRPLPWDRQAEHAPGDDKARWRPVFQYDGRTFMACFNERLIETGAALAGVPLDAGGQEAVAALSAVLEDPDLPVEFTIERGQVQFIDNRQFAHSRTDFRDASDPALRRHLIRIWTREEGRPDFHG
jgi:alpha-ketoglutarate-dependent taurine dioxygenase